MVTRGKKHWNNYALYVFNVIQNSPLVSSLSPRKFRIVVKIVQRTVGLTYPSLYCFVGVVRIKILTVFAVLYNFSELSSFLHTVSRVQLFFLSRVPVKQNEKKIRKNHDFLI